MLHKYLIFLFTFLLGLLTVSDAKKTVTVTSYLTKLAYTKTITSSPSPGTIVSYKSTTAKTITNSLTKWSTSTPKPTKTLTTKSYVYKYTTVPVTTTSFIKATTSLFKTYTVK